MGPAGSLYLQSDFSPVHCQLYCFPTNKTGMMGNSDSNGPAMSTGRGSLRNVCVAS